MRRGRRSKTFAQKIRTCQPKRGLVRGSCGCPWPAAETGGGERRRTSDEAAFLRGEALVPVHGAGAEAAARDRDNRGRRGGQLTVSWAPVAALAVIREVKRVAYREPHGCPRKRTGGRCTVPCPQLCRRTRSLGIESFQGGMLAGGFEVSLRRRGGGMEAGVRRARRRAERGMTIERRSGMAAVCAGPGRMPEPGAVVGAAFLSTGSRSAGRPGSGGARRAGGTTTGPRRAAGPAPTGQWSRCRPTTAPAMARRRGRSSGRRGGLGRCAARPRRPAPTARTAGAQTLGRRAAPGTACSRRSRWPTPAAPTSYFFGFGSKRHISPIKVADSGRSNGTEGWGEESAWRPAGIRDPRAARTWTGSPRKKSRRTARTGRRRSATPRGPGLSTCSRRPGERSAGTWRPASGRTSSWRWPARSRSTTQFWRRRGEPDGRVVPAARRVGPAVRGDSCNAVG